MKVIMGNDLSCCNNDNMINRLKTNDSLLVRDQNMKTNYSYMNTTIQSQTNQTNNQRSLVNLPRVNLQIDDYTFYEGYVKNGLAHGIGKLFRKDQRGDVEECYEGGFEEGKKNGYGVLTMKKGEIYKGQWVNDKKHGNGKQLYANGDIYKGNYKEDKREGFGFLELENGYSYEGDFKNNLFNGKGKMKFNEQGYYEGEWKDGYIKGKGVLKQMEPESVDYEGEFDYKEKEDSGELLFWESNRKLKGDKNRAVVGRWANGFFQFNK